MSRPVTRSAAPRRVAGVAEEMVPGVPRPHDGVGEKGRRPEGHRGAVGPDREGEKPGGCGEPEGPAARRRRGRARAQSAPVR